MSTRWATTRRRNRAPSGLVTPSSRSCFAPTSCSASSRPSTSGSTCAAPSSRPSPLRADPRRARDPTARHHVLRHPRFRLYENHFILRRRTHFRDGWNTTHDELTFKFRHPEEEKVRAVDLRPGCSATRASSSSGRSCRCAITSVASGTSTPRTAWSRCRRSRKGSTSKSCRALPRAPHGRERRPREGRPRQSRDGERDPDRVRDPRLRQGSRGRREPRALARHQFRPPRS